jgi:hypothetical protein
VLCQRMRILRQLRAIVHPSASDTSCWPTAWLQPRAVIVMAPLARGTAVPMLILVHKCKFTTAVQGVG